MNCILEIAFLGREEVIGLTLEEDLIKKLMGVQRLERQLLLLQRCCGVLHPNKKFGGSAGRWVLPQSVDCVCGGTILYEDYEEALVTRSLCKDLLVEALILGETNGLEDRHLVPLTTQPFWVRVKGVPLAYMERSTRQLIGDILGRFIETDSERGGTCLGSFMKIKCSFRDSVINHGDFKNFGSWLRAKVKEWLDEPEMKSPRPLRPRWVMKAPSSNELGLVDEVPC
ncbi:hypothetical protein L3X38_005028 [Prunus dulcis]|uniref:DUF4283 domain-containing protein n=1 Tax=Prunus dulcis TaxID=3755 RepID=A0AAD4ZQ61_PRUDU|nr:hypothetical protein L3X38_005028 [Prunus dulcis]